MAEFTVIARDELRDLRRRLLDLEDTLRAERQRTWMKSEEHHLVAELKRDLARERQRSTFWERRAHLAEESRAGMLKLGAWGATRSSGRAKS